MTRTVTSESSKAVRNKKRSNYQETDGQNNYTIETHLVKRIFTKNLRHFCILNRSLENPVSITKLLTDRRRDGQMDF